jgi:hypothetical protein
VAANKPRCLAGVDAPTTRHPNGKSKPASPHHSAGIALYPEPIPSRPHRRAVAISTEPHEQSNIFTRSDARCGRAGVGGRRSSAVCTDTDCRDVYMQTCGDTAWRLGKRRKRTGVLSTSRVRLGAKEARGSALCSWLPYFVKKILSFVSIPAVAGSTSTHFSLGAGISTASYLYMACQPVMHGKRKARVVGGAVEFLCAGLSRSRVAWRSHKARESFSVGN